MTGDPLVSICCLVYNHEPFLRQCLDGFVMQQTSFPFEAIVHDDASTDGSAAIIREYAEKYPDIIKPIYETENQYSKHNGTDSIFRLMVEAAMSPNSKYIALCEGDDYWTDPNKLQMQVDIMEADESIGLVHTLARVYDQQSESYKDELWGQTINSFEEELIANRTVTLTTCFKKDLFIKARQFFRSHKHEHKTWKMGDYPLWLYFSYYSKTHFIEKPTGVYRLLTHSASHNPDPQKMADFEQSAYDIRFFFANQFHYEHMLKTLATNLVSKMQGMSMKYDQRIEYDFHGLLKEYGLNHPMKLRLLHLIMQHDFLRHLYMRYLKLRTEKNTIN